MSSFFEQAMAMLVGLLAPLGLRFYGGLGTIHSTTVLNIEQDKDGKVVSVWFRCQPLPFDTTKVDKSRADDMNRMNKDVTQQIIGVVLKD